MKKGLLFVCMAILVTLIGFTSCEKDPPSAGFTYVAEGFTVTFTSVVTNTDSYTWDFGDGGTSTEANPVYAYTEAGEYEVTLTATGPGGTDSRVQTLTISPSAEDLKNMLSGGAAATNGKTWVLNRIYNAQTDGGSAVDPGMFLFVGLADNVLDLIGMGSEYDNEFTFYHDGSYEVDLVNDTALTATLFGFYGGEVLLYTMENNLYGLNKSSYTAPESSTWTFHQEDLVVDAVLNPLDTLVPAVHANVTFSGMNWVSLSEGAYFGVLDFPTTRKFIIKSITNESLNVALFVCAYWADPAGSGNLPTWLYHLTFVPKE
ncbi:MAG: PKD domain-containing protein [Bacteroidales bacterium]